MTKERTERGYRVTGRVQGVGFRWWTCRTADELGLEGSVKNRMDGSVEIRARGRPDDLDELGRRLERGPRSARVDRVERYDSDLPMRDGDFGVTY